MAVLKPGRIDADGNWLELDTMAWHMENALEPPPANDPEDSGKAGRRAFFIAISKGVIEYLKLQQNDAFVVHVNSDVGTLEIR